MRPAPKVGQAGQARHGENAWRNQAEVDVSGIDVKKLSDDELDKLIRVEAD